MPCSPRADNGASILRSRNELPITDTEDRPSPPSDDRAQQPAGQRNNTPAASVTPAAWKKVKRAGTERFTATKTKMDVARHFGSHVMKISSLGIAMLVVVVASGCATVPGSDAVDARLRIDELVALSRQGLSDQAVIAQIEQRGVAFVLSPQDVEQQRSAGVSDGVLRYLEGRASGEQSLKALITSGRYTVPAYSGAWYWGFPYLGYYAGNHYYGGFDYYGGGPGGHFGGRGNGHHGGGHSGGGHSGGGHSGGGHSGGGHSGGGHSGGGHSGGGHSGGGHSGGGHSGGGHSGGGHSGGGHSGGGH